MPSLGRAGAPGHSQQQPQAHAAQHEIGELFGGRDHTTVLHAVRKIADERSKDAQLNHELHVLEQTLKG